MNAPNRIWRDGATSDELRQVEAIDRELAGLIDRRSDLCRLRQRIANRACQRARYEKSRAEKKSGIM